MSEENRIRIILNGLLSCILYVFVLRFDLDDIHIPGIAERICISGDDESTMRYFLYRYRRLREVSTTMGSPI